MSKWGIQGCGSICGESAQLKRHLKEDLSSQIAGILSEQLVGFDVERCEYRGKKPGLDYKHYEKILPVAVNVICSQIPEVCPCPPCNLLFSAPVSLALSSRPWPNPQNFPTLTQFFCEAPLVVDQRHPGCELD